MTVRSATILTGGLSEGRQTGRPFRDQNRWNILTDSGEGRPNFEIDVRLLKTELQPFWSIRPLDQITNQVIFERKLTNKR
jgi:hypothetical protein